MPNLFRKIKDKITGAPTESMCEHLQRMGIDAEVLPPGSPEEIGGFGTLGSNAGCIKVKGQNFDLVQLVMRGTMGPMVVGGAGEFAAHFVVRGNLEGLKKQLKVKAKEKKTGFVTKKLINIKWEGDRLADLLNKDGELEKLLITAGKSPESEVDQKNQCVRLITSLPSVTKGVSIGPMPPVGKKSFKFPSKEFIEASNRIAKHVNSIIV